MSDGMSAAPDLSTIGRRIMVRKTPVNNRRMPPGRVGQCLHEDAPFSFCAAPGMRLPAGGGSRIFVTILKLVALRTRPFPSPNRAAIFLFHHASFFPRGPS